MPIYEFECRHCGHHFDHLQRLADADPMVCPKCGTKHLHRCVSAPAFRLAGTGWYETDFKGAHDHHHNLAGDTSHAPQAVPETATSKPAATESKSATAAT